MHRNRWVWLSLPLVMGLGACSLTINPGSSLVVYSDPSIADTLQMLPDGRAARIEMSPNDVPAVKVEPLLRRLASSVGLELEEDSGPGGMYTELGRTCVLGKASAALKEEFEFTLEARKFTLDLLKPGTPCKQIWDEYNAFMKKNKRPPESRLYCHGQGYDLVERPLIRHDEPLPIEENTWAMMKRRSSRRPCSGTASKSWPGVRKAPSSPSAAVSKQNWLNWTTRRRRNRSALTDSRSRACTG